MRTIARYLLLAVVAAALGGCVRAIERYDASAHMTGNVSYVVAGGRGVGKAHIAGSAINILASAN